MVEERRLPPPEELALLTPADATELAVEKLVLVRGSKAPGQERREITAALSLFEELSAAHSGWEPAMKRWRELSRAYELEELTQQLEGLWALTRRHLPLLLDRERNHIFNGLRLKRLYTRFYQNYSTAPRPTNEGGGVLLREAASDCTHGEVVQRGGLSRCSSCPGWFSF